MRDELDISVIGLQLGYFVCPQFGLQGMTLLK